MSAKTFLDWTRTVAEGERFELVGGQPVAMSPERNRHNLVKTACWQALSNAVLQARSDCTVLGDGATVVVSEEDVYEPDVTVQCGKPVDLDDITVTDPTIVVEVLSPSTAGVDSTSKLSGYFQLDSVVHYLILDPTKRVMIHHYREVARIETRIVREGGVTLDPPGIAFDVAECFAALDR